MPVNQNANMKTIKNIIFDLGGVLLNIDYHATSKAFHDLGASDFDALFTQFTANHLFESLETGEIEPGQFYSAVSEHCRPGTTENEIREAWNAMLLDFRKPSIDALGKLGAKYNIYLLSNTNAIHLEAFGRSFTEETGQPSIDNYFIRTYYSHLIGRRKPYVETYQYVLGDAGLIAEETLFIDDSLNNIEGAREAGLKVHHLLPGQYIEQLDI